MRNTCSVLLSAAQFILLLSLRSSKPCESSEHTFPFVENCRNHRCSVGKSSQRTASTSYLWHGHTHKKEAQKRKKKRSRKKAHPRESTPLLFFALNKEKWRVCTEKKPLTASIPGVGSQMKSISLFCCCQHDCTQTWKRICLNPISSSKDQEGGRG